MNLVSTSLSFIVTAAADQSPDACALARKMTDIWAVEHDLKKWVEHCDDNVEIHSAIDPASTGDWTGRKGAEEWINLFNPDNYKFSFVDNDYAYQSSDKKTCVTRFLTRYEETKTGASYETLFSQSWTFNSKGLLQEFNQGQLSKKPTNAIASHSLILHFWQTGNTEAMKSLISDDVDLTIWQGVFPPNDATGKYHGFQGWFDWLNSFSHWDFKTFENKVIGVSNDGNSLVTSIDFDYVNNGKKGSSRCHQHFTFNREFKLVKLEQGYVIDK